MGAGNSTMSYAMNDIINRTINNISNDVKNLCIVNSKNKQDVKISFNKVTGCSLNLRGITQEIESSTSMDCKNANIDQTALETTLKNNLEVAAKTVKDSPLLTFGDSASATSINKAINEITSDVNIKKVTESVLNSLNDQDIIINIKEWRCLPYKDKWGNITGTTIDIGDISQDILNNAILSSLIENKSVVEATTTIDNQLKASASATSLGLTSGLLALLLPLLFGFIVFMIIIGIGMKLMGSIGGSFRGVSVSANKQSFGQTENKPSNIPKILLIVFSIFSFILFVVQCGQIGQIVNYSKNIYMYYALLVFYFLFSIITIVMIILYHQKNSNLYMALSIVFAILSLLIFIVVIIMTQMEINDFKNMINEFSSTTPSF